MYIQFAVAQWLNHHQEICLDLQGRSTIQVLKGFALVFQTPRKCLLPPPDNGRRGV